MKSVPLVSHVKPCFRSLWFLFLCLTTFAFAPLAWSQGADDVHVYPRTSGVDPGTPGVHDLKTDDAPSLHTGTPPMHVDVNLALVPVIVTDSVNRPVLGLERGNFALYEGDKQQQILYFSTEDAPVSIGLIVDLSGTMKNKIGVAGEAIREFFRNANPEDDYFVITFADRPELLADTTQSIGTIEAKLASAKPAGYTALLDAIYLGINKLRSARYERRALLIVSDGGDNASRYHLSDIKSLIEEANVEVYAIGIFDPFPILGSIEEKFGKHLLTQVTECSGGRTIAVENPAMIPQVAATISQEIRNQYVLGYRPDTTARNGKWRKIRVRVQKLLATEGSTTLRAFYKKGYAGPSK